MLSGDNKFTIESSNNYNLLQRFPYGSYVIIDEEIMRVSTNTLQGTDSNEIAVIRGVFGTLIQTHQIGSLIKKINPFPIQFNRPSIIRASGHTFEYLGYGPGNYSTALPQVQVKTISEKEEFLSQSQERSSGAVVYTGMNNKGDFYIGNQKKSALTGEETSFDTPIPSVTGEDPGRLSVVFDEVTVKERLVVEGGKSKTSLSEFDGPVTFNNEVQHKDIVKIKSTTESTSATSGSLVISGGVGIGGTVNIADDAKLFFGNDSDLSLFHSGTSNVIESTGSLEFKGNPIKLTHGGTTRFETISAGATITGDMYATNYYGNGGTLDGIDQTKLVDSSSNTRAQATATGVTITGTLSATTTADATPAIIARNTGGLNSTIQRWVGESDSLEVQQPSSGGDYQIMNTGGNHGIRFYDGGSGVRLLWGNEYRMAILSTSVRIGDPSLSDIDLLVTGDITAFNSSDIRLKDNISPITKALEKVKSISGNTYTKKSDGSAHTGVIAQEIEALGLPGITTTRSSGYMAVDYEKLVPLLIEAIKELSTKVDTLENQINN